MPVYSGCKTSPQKTQVGTFLKTALAAKEPDVAEPRRIRKAACPRPVAQTFLSAVPPTFLPAGLDPVPRPWVDPSARQVWKPAVQQAGKPALRRMAAVLPNKFQMRKAAGRRCHRPIPHEQSQLAVRRTRRTTGVSLDFHLPCGLSRWC